MKPSIPTTLSAALASSVLGMVASAQDQGLPRQDPAPRPGDLIEDRSDPLIEPSAIAAMRAMGEAMRALDRFEVTAHTTTESVLENGQKVTLPCDLLIKADRPNRFTMEARGDHRVRRYVYDGAELTVHAPQAGTFSQVAASGTIEQILDLAFERYGLELPLKELFHWSEIGKDTDDLQTALYIGSPSIGGRRCDHFVYRGPAVDWQIWLAREGPRLPCKVAATNRYEQAMPQFTADLDWRTDATFEPGTFSFTPPEDARAIALTRLAGD